VTSKYVAPIRRVDTAKSHYYVDANGERVPGVTTILSDGIPKPALINWSANSTAEYAVDHWDELAQLSPSARMKELQSARYKEKDRAANRGTEVHDLAEKLTRGDEVEVPDLLAGYVESCVQFLEDFAVRPILLETTCMSHQYGWAGTFDAILEFTNGLKGLPMERPRILIDWKTNRSGIFGETALQLAGYRHADTYLDENGDEQPMPEVDGCAAVHLRPDGYDLIPVVAGEEQLLQLRYAKQVAGFVKHSRDLVGAPVEPAGRTPRRRLELVPFGQAATA
jgi:hypothetical protein